MRSALLDTGVTVQYDAAREVGRQLGVEIPVEAFSKRQQRQSRMDGGEDENGTLRGHVDLAPPLEQPPIEREQCLAAAESRVALTGGVAYREVPLTGAFQATFPAHRQRISFGHLMMLLSLLPAAAMLASVMLLSLLLAPETSSP